MLNIFDFLKKTKKNYYPKYDNIFDCFKYTGIENVKVVIIGQDPYCLPNQANGLAFSVPLNVKLTPTLKNIFIELKNDLNVDNLNNGFLLPWAKQGVLLLNSVLTVEDSKPGSHFNIGWEIFTNKVINLLVKYRKNLIFVLWGKNAFKKANLINYKNNYIISSSHPSPRSADISFFGSRPFSKINMHLKLLDKDLINWNTNIKL